MHIEYCPADCTLSQGCSIDLTGAYQIRIDKPHNALTLATNILIQPFSKYPKLRRFF